MSLNIGDIVFQVVAIVSLIGFFAMFLVIIINFLRRSPNKQQNSQLDRIEEKLDYVIEQLNKK